MESIDILLADAHRWIKVETTAVQDLRRSRGNRAGKAIDDARDARARLLPILNQIAEIRNIDALLEVEGTFLALELEHLAEAKIKTSSLENAILYLEAAKVMVAWVRRVEDYRRLDIAFSLTKNRDPILPRDQARQFFTSHLTRLMNLEKGRMEADERAVLLARHANISLAQQLYMDLQRAALAPEGLREPHALYRVEKRKLALCA